MAEIGTITQIRKKRDSIREKIKSLNLNNNSNTYGNESEYNYRDVIGGLEALLTDISTLTKGSNKFVKISTYSERNAILTNLTRIDQYLENPANYLPHFEALKLSLRNYNVRYFSDRQVEFETEIEEVRKIKLQLQQILTETNNLKESINQNNNSIEELQVSSNKKLQKIETELENIIETKEKLVAQSVTLEEINENIIEIKKTASENLKEVTSSMTESKSNEKLITSFASKVLERDKRLAELDQKIKDNEYKLRVYNEERKSYLQEAKDLINSAKKALNYKTAEGISASFQTQYDNAKGNSSLGWWVFGAILCLLSTVFLGLWVLETTPSNIGLIIGRISILPLPIIGAIFCANQYTKQKNIIEDYAYKMVLSKSIVGFSEQLRKNGSENNEEYIHYIKTALEEIHKDPLRKRERSQKNKNETPQLKDLVEVAEKIVKMTKVE